MHLQKSVARKRLKEAYIANLKAWLAERVFVRQHLDDIFYKSDDSFLVMFKLGYCEEYRTIYYSLMVSSRNIE